MKTQILTTRKSFNLALLLIVLTGLTSCSMTFEKRHYRKGYYIDIVKNNNRKVSVAQDPKKQIHLFEKEIVQSDEENVFIVEEELTPIFPIREATKNNTVVTTDNTVKVEKKDRGNHVLNIHQKGHQKAVLEDKVGKSRLTHKPNHIKDGAISNGAGEMVLGILAFVFGVFALVMSVLTYSSGAIILASVFASLAFILGIIGTPVSATRMHPDNMSMTLVGLVLSALAILFAMIVLVILVL